MGRLHTRYSPVRRSSASIATPVTPRLACVKPPASVHPEPGSNSSLYIVLIPLRVILISMFMLAITLPYLLPFLITSLSMNSLLPRFSSPSFFLGLQRYLLFFSLQIFFSFPITFFSTPLFLTPH